MNHFDQMCRLTQLWIPDMQASVKLTPKGKKLEFYILIYISITDKNLKVAQVDKKLLYETLKHFFDFPSRSLS